MPNAENPAPSSLSPGDLEIVIRSEAMRRLLRMAERVAAHNAAVLISGETGSGKEVLARAIHNFSPRRANPWVDINCAALPERLMESELFGYEKGAFSGADAPKQGMFELAHTGTLFLDEIGELEPSMQVKLLRVLDGVPYFRLGGNRKITVDVRIVAATNQDLLAATRIGRFRTDLFHRLTQFHLQVPPLRERPEDIIPLAEFFLRLHTPEARFSPAALTALQGYRWPGNVRELRNVVLQAAMLKTAGELVCADLPNEIFAGIAKQEEPLSSDLGEMERQMIIKALARTEGHQGKAAAYLGISRRTLSRKLRQYNIAPPKPPEKPLGSLSSEQRDYFRAQIKASVLVRSEANCVCNVTAVNISAGGLGIEDIAEPGSLAGALALEFSLPNSEFLFKAAGHLRWADPHGRGGISFVQVPPEVQEELDDWLTQRQEEEGWQAD
jgi:DNA-binding NtrC family response regulator